MNLPAPLAAENAVLIVIDMQERLLAAMHEKEKLLRNTVKLVRGAQVLEIPILLTEQYPKGLGTTVPEIKKLLPDATPIEKLSFSCCDEVPFLQALEAFKRRQVLIAGIEAHICVYQTASALARMGYEVHVVSDCISSRERENRLICLLKVGLAGIHLTTSEMALFELLKVARGDKFKQISNIVK